MGAILYTGPTGRAVQRNSYSSGLLFNSCRYKYKQEKILGVRRKEKSGAMQFGKAIEDAIQFFHQNKLAPGSGVDAFIRLFRPHKDDPELVYTKRDISWDNLNVAGQQMLRLYEVLLPKLPIVDPRFQLSYSKELWPGDEVYGGLEDGGFVDMISQTSRWDHPLLPKVPRGEGKRTVGIDIKAMGAPLNLPPGLLRLDPQLRRYAWFSFIDTWAFLWFTKSSVASFQKGVEISFLTSSENWTAGDKAVVFKFDEEDQSMLLTTHEGLQRISELLAAEKGKGSTERKDAIIAGLLADNDLLPAKVEDVTKQQLQFLAVEIDDEAKQEAGENVAKEVFEIYHANLENKWPRNPSVRFPDTRCGFCSHRGLCTGDKSLVDKLLVQIMDINAVEAEVEEPEEDDWGLGE